MKEQNNHPPTNIASDGKSQKSIQKSRKRVLNQFYKRRKTLLQKAHDLHTDCGVDIHLVVRSRWNNQIWLYTNGYTPPSGSEYVSRFDSVEAFTKLTSHRKPFILSQSHYVPRASIRCSPSTNSPSTNPSTSNPSTSSPSTRLFRSLVNLNRFQYTHGFRSGRTRMGIYRGVRVRCMIFYLIEL